MTILFALAIALAQQVDIAIDIDDPRPLSAASELLELKYGVPISYEDVRLSNANDQVRAIERYTKGTVPPDVAIPAGGQLSIHLATNPDGSAVGSPDAMVAFVVAQHQQNQNPGEFRVLHAGPDGEHLVIVPSAARDPGGALTAQQSPLDTLISFPVEDRTARDTIRLIQARVGEALGIEIISGGLVDNTLLHNNVTMGAESEPARDVLLRVFREILPGQKYVPQYSWRFKCEPGGKLCALNLHGVVKEVRTRFGEIQREPVYRKVD